jgi:hypothetical protein
LATETKTESMLVDTRARLSRRSLRATASRSLRHVSAAASSSSSGRWKATTASSSTGRSRRLGFGASSEEAASSDSAISLGIAI